MARRALRCVYPCSPYTFIATREMSSTRPEYYVRTAYVFALLLRKYLQVSYMLQVHFFPVFFARPHWMTLERFHHSNQRFFSTIYKSTFLFFSSSRTVKYVPPPPPAHLLH